MKLNEPFNQTNQPGRGRRAEVRGQVGSIRNRRSAPKAHLPAARLSASPRLRVSPSSPNRVSASSPRYSIRKHIAFWAVDFEGQTAVFDHEQGAYYVAYLLLNPPEEPIHGMALELKSDAFFNQRPTEPCETFITDPETGKTMILGFDAELVEQNLWVDEGDDLAPLRRKIEELEAILDDDSASPPVKAEVLCELQEYYEYEKENLAGNRSAPQKAVRAVRQALYHFHKTLATAVNPQGNPHGVLRAFAAYIEEHILIPTARYSKPRGAHTAARIAGRFTYEPPPGVKWTA